MKRSLSIVSIVMVMVFGAILFLNGANKSRVDLKMQLPFSAHAQEANAENVEIDIIEMIQGDENAPITLLEYASFTCPHCASFHENTYPELKKNYIDTGKVKFHYREVYFDKYGLWASLVARCGGPVRFFGLTDFIYKKQKEWSRAGDDLAIINELIKLGKLAGLGDEQLQACVKDGAQVRALIEWFQANATADNVSATPTLFIDGVKYNNMPYVELAAILDEKLSDTK